MEYFIRYICQQLTETSAVPFKLPLKLQRRGFAQEGCNPGREDIGAGLCLGQQAG